MQNHVKRQGSFTGYLVSSRQFHRMPYIVEAVLSTMTLAEATGNALGGRGKGAAKGGGKDFGFHRPLTLARDYQDLKIQDYILKLNLLQSFKIIKDPS